jgi:hypothetical protein
MTGADTLSPAELSSRYGRCIEVSRRIRWDIDRDVIRGRSFDFSRRFLPYDLSRVGLLDFLSLREQRLLNQIQGRTYANMIGLVERFIGATMLEISRDHWFADQVALEALVRFADEELKHQLLFRRIEQMMAAGMPAGYEFVAEPNGVARAVTTSSTWAVLALTCHIELFTQVHYHYSIEPDAGLSELFKDVFLFHWKEESQHAVLDELEWRREDARLTPEQRDRSVDDLVRLFRVLDAIVRDQARADAHYFLRICGREFSRDETRRLQEGVLGAYRWQYVGSGVQESHFCVALGTLLAPAQVQRVRHALAAIAG